MKHLKKFNEGWKENTLVGLLSLFGVAGMSQNKHKDIRTYHTKSEQTAKSMIKNGWSLDSTQIDTLWKEVQVSKPDTMVMVDRLSLDKDQYFASGKFELSQEVKDSIQITLDEIINKGGIITEVRVESSTDKQGLSNRLQTQLKSIGYSGDNKGLSQARSEAVTNYLVELGVNKTLIDVNQKYEIGQETIQQSARYVNVDISYMIINKEVAPSKSVDQPEVKTTYWLSKEKTKSHYHKQHRSRHFELGSIKILKGRKSAIDACPFFQK
jgi:outer membrane protein OmpA-like peptidoglycan-associated protein